LNKLTLELDHRRQTVFSVPGAAGTADFGCMKLKFLSAFLEMVLSKELKNKWQKVKPDPATYFLPTL